MSENQRIIIGSRGSDLALWQAHHVKTKLENLGCEVSIEIIQTQGDLIQDLSFDKLEGKGFFTKEIEKALLDLYEKIRGNGGGVGAAALVGNKCNGCNLAINAVEMERIKSLAKDELLRCEECRRILVRI